MDRRTDGQTESETDTTQSQYRAMHYSAWRGKNGVTDSYCAMDERTRVKIRLGHGDGYG